MHTVQEIIKILDLFTQTYTTVREISPLLKGENKLNLIYK